MNLITELQNNSRNKSQKPRGVVLFEAPQYAVIATFNSNNRKTGKMIQVWIIHRYVNPVEAVKTGADVVICGDCKHRRFKGGACYVNVGQSVAAIFKAYQRGSYPKASDYLNVFDLFKGKAVRFGAYGDPALIPMEIVEGITAVASRWTGYTHMWQYSPQTAKYFMASVDNEAEYQNAIELGFRTFKVVMDGYEAKDNEILCPSEKGVSCLECGLCAGKEKKAKNIFIPVHGTIKSRFKVEG